MNQVRAADETAIRSVLKGDLGVSLHRLVREQEGRKAEPTACVIEVQSGKVAPCVPTSTQSTGAGKKIVAITKPAHPRACSASR
ncbi:hypothetical protein [Streptomyces sp. NPDC001222]|uniref:hypothetical protein n=1 Tax=Streptomyces sp. NPDC001222 TaxID=3364548 RepID=UPI00367A23BE